MTYVARKNIKLKKLFSLKVPHSLLSNLPHGVLHCSVKKGIMEFFKRKRVGRTPWLFQKFTLWSSLKQNQVLRTSSQPLKKYILLSTPWKCKKSSTWSSSMVLSFKDSMANSKSYLMEYSIIMQRKRLMEFFKKSVLPQEVLHWYV